MISVSLPPYEKLGRASAPLDFSVASTQHMTLKWEATGNENISIIVMIFGFSISQIESHIECELLSRPD